MFSIERSQEQARERLQRTSKRRRRSDAGKSRLLAPVLAELRAAVLGMDRPPMAALHRRIANASVAQGRRPPSRATLYAALASVDGHAYDVSLLPPHVMGALYNLASTGAVPGHQLAFYCFNYGSLAAASFAAGLPWLDLYQAARLRGWRPQSRGLLEAVLRARGI